MEIDLIQTRGVLAGAYTNESTFLTHAYNTETHKPLCKRVKADNIADFYSNMEGNSVPATCPVCSKRDPRFNPGLPKLTKTIELSGIQKRILSAAIALGTLKCPLSYDARDLERYGLIVIQKEGLDYLEFSLTDRAKALSL